MLDSRLNYVLLRIRPGTDRMACEFLKEYAMAPGDCMLSEKNRYYSSVSGISNNNGIPSGGLVFREAELGVTFAALHRLVVEAVATSVMSSTLRSLTPGGSTQRVPGGTSPRPKGFGHASIREDEEVSGCQPDIRLEEGPPQWDKWSGSMSISPSRDSQSMPPSLMVRTSAPSVATLVRSAI